MQLILWRHAEAEDSNPLGDSARELTKKGHKQAERVAKWLRPHLEGDWRILVSPAARALQTVQPLDLEFEESEAVGLSATASTILRAAGWPDNEQSVVVVGHQPTLGHVAARLVGGAVGEVAIRKGAIWWFATRRRNGTETILQAVVNPEQV